MPPTTPSTDIRMKLANLGSGLVILSFVLIVFLGLHKNATVPTSGSFLVAASSTARPLITSPRKQDSIRGVAPLARPKPVSEGSVGLGSPNTGALKIQSSRPSVAVGAKGDDVNERPHVEETEATFYHGASVDELYHTLLQCLTIPLLAGALAYMWRPRTPEPLTGKIKEVLGVDALPPFADEGHAVLAMGAIYAQEPRRGKAAEGIFVDRNAPDDGNADLEYARFFRRHVFDHSDWRDHRSVKRKARELSSLFASRIIRNSLREVAYVTLIACAVAYADSNFPEFQHYTFPTFPFTLSASSLGLLLTFRTSNSYSRFSEVRNKWATLTSRTRDLTRQTVCWFPNDTNLKNQMCRQLTAWPYVLKCHLRGGPGGFEDDNDIKENLGDVLTPLEMETLLSSGHRPKHILSNITTLTTEAGLTKQRMQSMDNNVTVFEDVLGGCERLLRTPIPLPYTRLASRFLSLWLLCLPFAMVPEMHKLGLNIWAMVPSMSFLSLLLLSMEEVAIQIEEPFTILPFDSIADELSDDIKEMRTTSDQRFQNLQSSRFLKP